MRDLYLKEVEIVSGGDGSPDQASGNADAFGGDGGFGSFGGDGGGIQEIVVTAPHYQPPPGYVVAPGDITLTASHAGEDMANSASVGASSTSLGNTVTQHQTTYGQSIVVGGGTVYNPTNNNILPGTYVPPAGGGKQP